MKIIDIEQVTYNIFFPTVEIKDYNVMIHRQNLFDYPVKDDLRIYGNIQKTVIV